MHAVTTTLMHDLAEAFRFLTVFPLKQSSTPKPGALARAMIFFPLVGFVIGAFSLMVYAGAQRVLPPRLATLVLLLTPVLISGGLHVDGFADFCDGFFGGRDRESVLRIMKDSRIGAWGATGLIFLFLFKFELLQELPQKTVFFLMAMAVSRWSQVILSMCLPYAGNGGGLGQSVARQVGSREAAGATLIILPLVFAAGLRGAAVFGVYLVLLAGMGFWFKKKLGGITGDLLGAASEASEVIIFLLAVIAGNYV